MPVRRIQSSKKTRQETPTGGPETILVVEDEPAILELARLMLENLGYRILTAGSPTDAFRVAGSCTGKIDLLMTDVIMPGMNGRDLAGRLASMHPPRTQNPVYVRLYGRCDRSSRRFEWCGEFYPETLFHG